MADTAQTETNELQPSVTISDIGPAKKKLAIEVSAEAIAAKLAENFDSLKDEAQLPGFRRGHAPMKLLQKRFGSDVRKEVCSQLVGEGYTHAIESNELRVLGEPDIKDYESLELPESGPLSFEVEVEVAPEVELPDLKDIPVEKPTFEVSDEDIDAELSRYCEMYGQPKAADKAEPEDYIGATVIITDAESKEVLHEQLDAAILVTGERREFKGVVSGILVADLGKKLAGAAKGDSVTVEATGPAGHENEKLRDKKLSIEIKIEKIERLEPMALSELVETAGFETEDELRQQVRERLEAQAASRQSQAMAQQVVKALMDKVDIELPEGLSDRQAGRILQRRASDMIMRGAKQEEIEEQLAELRAVSKETAQEELKTLFILDAVANKLDVEVNDQEVNGRVVQIAMQQGQRPQKVRDEMARNGQLQQLYVQIREEKAIEKILEQAKVTEISADEWEKKQGGDDKPKAEAKTTKKKTTKKKTTKKKTTKKKSDTDSDD